MDFCLIDFGIRRVENGLDFKWLGYAGAATEFNDSGFNISTCVSNLYESWHRWIAQNVNKTEQGDATQKFAVTDTAPECCGRTQIDPNNRTVLTLAAIN